MENVALRAFADIYRGRRVLVTGHTGFKGSWLALWLKELGAHVTGVALPAATDPSHWATLGLDLETHNVDVRDGGALAEVIRCARPEIVFHLAAQALVRDSYSEPAATWQTNVLGAVNILEACRQSSEVRAVLVVTTDKCYQNKEQRAGYVETDRLGGHDPYSASKAAAELVVASYRSAFFSAVAQPLVATARAGNVIGGGDWSKDRLVPDLVRAITARRPLIIRSPQSTRPWQHVLDSLSGYLLLGQKLLEGRREFAEAWNFGPTPDGNRAVEEVLTRLRGHWSELHWEISTDQHPHESKLLYLDSAKARRELDWEPVWGLDEALAATAEWYRSYLQSDRIDSRKQLVRFVETARLRRREWAAT